MAEGLDVEDLGAWLAFSTAPGLDLKSAVALLRAYGGPAPAIDASVRELREIVPVEQARAVALPPGSERAEQIEATLEWLSQRSGAFAVTLADPDYPKGLLELPDPPFVLLGLGCRKLLASRFVSILGTRRPSAGGARMARDFGAGLAQAGLGLASAMMEGVEAESLAGALEAGGAACVICATPLDRVYPPASRDVMIEIAKNGVLLSFLMKGTPFAEENIGRRTQLLAAFSDATVVMEADRTSRALAAARLAAGLGRDVFAVPGDVRSPLSKGPHRLIREGARLVESVADVANDLRPLASPRITLRDRDDI